MSFLLRCVSSIVYPLYLLKGNAVFDQGRICIVLAGELKKALSEAPRRADWYALDAEIWTERRRRAALATCPVRWNIIECKFCLFGPKHCALVDKYGTRYQQLFFFHFLNSAKTMLIKQ